MITIRNIAIFLISMAVATMVFQRAALPPAPSASPSADRPVAGVQSALSEGSWARGAVPAPCGEGGVALNDVVAVNGDHPVLLSPDDDAPRLKNEKASRALGRDHYHQIDRSTTVRRVCAQSDWTEFQIVTPDWLTHVRGWVRSEALREMERSASGVRRYVEEDFHWDADTSDFKSQIVEVINAIARDNPNCAIMDTSSIAKSPSRSKPNDPVFFVACGTGSDLVNVWFRPTDAAAGQSFRPLAPIARDAAVDACEAAAKRAATHPSTVQFSKFLDLAYLPHISGRARVVSSFSAKNGLGVELKYRIDCLFDGHTLMRRRFLRSEGAGLF